MINIIRKALSLDNVIIKKHAFTRMNQRRIDSEELIKVILDCDIVEKYDDDRPFPSFLLLGYSNNRPLHVVLSYDSDSESIFIITVYEPSAALWESDFKTRRKQL